jgi:hypothetical protein
MKCEKGRHYFEKGSMICQCKKYDRRKKMMV